jgi:hypothetical protein
MGLKVSEDNFMGTVLELAKRTGWASFHARPAQITVHGGVSWRTPVQGNGAGFPDLFLAKPSHYPVIAELKSDMGKLTEDQERWRDILELSLSVRYFLWRPGDWDEIVAVLTETATNKRSHKVI